MSRIKGLVQRSKNVKIFQKISLENAYAIQEKTLQRLLLKSKNTFFGEVHQFGKILKSDFLIDAFKNQVPLGDYGQMLPWWKRLQQGEQNITWPGKVSHFALSSGTTDGASKYIPITKEMLRSMRRASFRQMLSINRNNVGIDTFAKHWLMVGGSTNLEYNGVFYSGDLSGIATNKVPILFQRFSKPEPAIRHENDWQEKIQKMTLEAKNWDVGLVAGVPAWIQMLFERILEHYQLDNIHQMWPNFRAYAHGGVAMRPYKKRFNELLGREIKYFETYLASEGFIAFQRRMGNEIGMRLLIRNGIFYEFIPFDEKHFDSEGSLLSGVQTQSIRQVEENKDYALVMSTNAGAWRYLIGDVIQFTNLEELEIKISGRTKHFISLCGEHLSVDNMNQAIADLAESFGLNIPEFCVVGQPYQGFFAHQWYLGIDRDFNQTEALQKALDERLKELNADYATERQAALKGVFVRTLPQEIFIAFMRKRGREGAQNKFPRVLRGELLEEWTAFVENKV